MTAPETTIRQAIWSAIENWPDTQNAFQQKYKWEDSLVTAQADGFPDPPAMPAISITPTEETYEWHLNRTQENLLNFKIIVFTRSHNLLTAEDLIYKVRDAIWKCEHHTGVTWIRKYTGEPPRRFTNIAMKHTYVGQNKDTAATVTTMMLQLRRLNDPLPALTNQE